MLYGLFFFVVLFSYKIFVRLVVLGEFRIRFLRGIHFMCTEMGLGLGTCICCFLSSFRVVRNGPLWGTRSQQNKGPGGVGGGFRELIGNVKCLFFIFDWVSFNCYSFKSYTTFGISILFLYLLLFILLSIPSYSVRW